jgi:hypothetical protein
MLHFVQHDIDEIPRIATQPPREGKSWWVGGTPGEGDSLRTVRSVAGEDACAGEELLGLLLEIKRRAGRFQQQRWTDSEAARSGKER